MGYGLAIMAKGQPVQNVQGVPKGKCFYCEGHESWAFLAWAPTPGFYVFERAKMAAFLFEAKMASVLSNFRNSYGQI